VDFPLICIELTEKVREQTGRYDDPLTQNNNLHYTTHKQPPLGERIY